MAIEFGLIFEILKLVVAGVATFIAMRVLDRRPKLIVHYGHVASHWVESENPFQMGTHTVVIRNAGRNPATNVKVSHNVLPPNISVYPAVKYYKESVPNSADNLVFPVLSPKQEVIVSYLYYAPLNYANVNTGVRSDEGLAKVVTMVPTQQRRKWQQFVVFTLLAVGSITLLYFAFLALRWTGQAFS